MPNLKQYQRHVDLYGHECVMMTADADEEMSERDVKALAHYIASTAKKLIKPKGAK